MEEIDKAIKQIGKEHVVDYLTLVKNKSPLPDAVKLAEAGLKYIEQKYPNQESK
jgi:hypothetical protein